MEVVLRSTIPFQGICIMPWKRIIRGCLILCLSGVLFVCIQNYTQNYEMEMEGRGVQFQTADISHGIDISNVCGSVKSIVRNAAGEDLDFSESFKENVIFAQNQTVKKEIMTTEKAEIKEDIIESTPAVSGTVNAPDDAPVRNPEIDSWVDASFITVTEDNSRTDLTFTSDPVVDEESVNGENAKLREIAGFMVDEEGYIVECMADLAVIDGIVVIPADEKCIGIRTGSLSAAGQDAMEIYIPANITDIEPGAFDACPCLMYIEVSAKNPCYYSVDGILYVSSGEIAVYPAGR